MESDEEGGLAPNPSPTMKRISARAATSQFGFVSAKEGNVSELRNMLDKGLDPDAVDSEQHTLLMWAAQTGSLPVAQLLLERGANVDLAGGAWMPTPLLLAAENGYAPIAELLLKHGADPNRSDCKMHTPLMYACANGFFRVTAALLDAGAYTSLVATKSISDKSFGHRLSFMLAGVNWQDQANGETALHYAARYGHAELIGMLKKSGSDLNAQDDSGKTPMFWATTGGHIEVVASLAECGAKVDIPDIDGNTPLMWACRLGYQEIAAFLIDRGADVNYSPEGDSHRGPLAWAIQFADEAIIEMLKERGAVIHRRPFVVVVEDALEIQMSRWCCA